jgi:hypothetical protein
MGDDHLALAQHDAPRGEILQGGLVDRPRQDQVQRAAKEARGSFIPRS